jgi:hypothetical protein
VNVIIDVFHYRSNSAKVKIRVMRVAATLTRRGSTVQSEQSIGGHGQCGPYLSEFDISLYSRKGIVEN